MRPFALIKKLGILGLKKELVDAQDIGKAYNLVSENYEQKFLTKMHQYNDQVIEAFVSALSPQASVLVDLACGTGYNSQRLHQLGVDATIDLVDVSEGMLSQARAKQLPKASYIQQDMLGYLRSQGDQSVDGVVCCWAIKYQPPKEVIREVYRVLRPGGVFGVIVNTKQTLPEIRKIYPKLLASNPDCIQKIMRDLPNPKSKKIFVDWFEHAGFETLRAEEGKQVFEFQTTGELGQWVTHTGALAGFDCMIDLRNPKVQGELIRLLEKEKVTSLTHDFVWAVLRK
ncbi:MAG: class I SAM-dependent methyltransferase [Cellulosilyticaceae bacterium]